MKKVITISREFGSGGRTIAKQVAEELGYSFYDKEIIEKLAEKTGLSQKYIEQNSEYAKGHNIFSYAFIGRDASGASVEDTLQNAQRELIENLAETGSCVIVGRCADYILKDRPDCMHVFIHAGEEIKAKRIVELYGETDENPVKRLRDKDKRRAANYKYYTDRQWGVAKNYHLSLDSGEFGIDACVKMIIQLVKEGQTH